MRALSAPRCTLPLCFQLLFISSFPLAALALLAIDVLVIYGLASWDYRDT
jgi:hypothetical protein